MAREGYCAVSAGSGAGVCSFVGRRSFAEDEEFDEDEQDEGEGELAEEEAPGKGA